MLGVQKMPQIIERKSNKNISKISNAELELHKQKFKCSFKYIDESNSSQREVEVEVEKANALRCVNSSKIARIQIQVNSFQYRITK